MTKEELSKELEKLEPLEALNLILQATRRAYPDMGFHIQSYKLPTRIEIPTMRGKTITATYTKGDEQ